MAFRFTSEKIPAVITIEPRVFEDERGMFMETYKRSEFDGAGIPWEFVQENHSRSIEGTIRGLHFQRAPKAQGKLIRVVRGEVFDVAVDIRRGSPSFGTWVGNRLSAENKRMLFLPPWCAHGFCVVSDVAEVLYKTTAEYAPELEGGILWNDPEIGIDWPTESPVLSERDRAWPLLRESDSGFAYESP